MEGTVTMTLSEYDILRDQLRAKTEEVKSLKEYINGEGNMFTFEPCLDDKKASIVLTTTGRKRLDDFIANHPEYKYGYIDMRAYGVAKVTSDNA